MRAKMKDDIKDIFSNVNEWLKFAEAKNAALIVFHLGSIFGVATIITQNKCGTIPHPILYYLYSFIILSTVGLFFALFSFLPQTRIEDVLGKKIEDFFCSNNFAVEENLLFYGYINSCDRDSYLSKLCESCEREIGQCSKLELDYVNQIVTNSRLTVRKYFYFRIALFFTIIAVISPILLPLIILYNIVNRILIEQHENTFTYIVMFIISSVVSWRLIVKYVII